MKGQVGFLIGGALVALSTIPHAKQASAAQACADPNSCVQVTLGSASGKVGETKTVSVTFKQAPSNGAAGGPDEIAALAMTIALGNGTGVPLGLADCTLGSDGLPLSVKPDPSISNFKVVVENASCANARTHCLCPDPASGIVPDNFINMVIYGPNPLPTPGPTPIDIPTLPAGPQILVNIDLSIKACPTGASGVVTVPVHVYNEVEDTSHPQFTALLSVGDKLAVDQTCVPVTGQPPCSSPGAVSQVAVTNGSVAVTCSPPCVGDCDHSGDVTVNELITMVNIALNSLPLSACPIGDADNSGDITVNEIIQAVNYALTQCPI